MKARQKLDEECVGSCQEEEAITDDYFMEICLWSEGWLEMCSSGGKCEQMKILLVLL